MKMIFPLCLALLTATPVAIAAIEPWQSPATIPLFLTINYTEAPDALHQMTVLRKRLAELGSDEIFMMDREPRGHKVTLVPEILDAMNLYLKQRLH